MVENKNLIHIGVPRDEAVQAKRDILASEMILLNILKRETAYKTQRLREFDLKLDLYKKVRALKLKLGDLSRSLPRLKSQKETPKASKREQDQERPVVKKEKYDSSIEGQLLEIQRKLDSLG
jgi:hypothetical protein